MNPPPADGAREPPHNIEAEEYLLSCCLLDGCDSIASCLKAKLPAAAFHSPANRVCYEKIVELYHKCPPVDTAVLAEALKTSNQLVAIGGYSHLTRISGLQPTTAKVQNWLDSVLEYYIRRELLKDAQTTLERAGDTTVPLDDLIEETKGHAERAGKLAAGKKTDGFTVWRISDFAQHDPPKDDAILGEGEDSVYWRDRQLALLLGPGGVGKSRLRLNLAVWQITGRAGIGFKTFGPPRKWLLTGNENSVAREKAALAAMLTTATNTERELLQEYLLIQALVGDEADSMALDDSEALDLWRATAEKWRPDILGLDPWESVIIGGDCNDSPATRESVRLIRSIFSPYNARFTPLIVHHAKEGAQAARSAEGWEAGAFAKGSKTIRAMARFAINVAPEDPDDGGRIVLACGKMNDGKKFVTRGAILDEETHFYSLNHDFDLDAWRADVEGKQGGKSCSIRDVYEAIRDGKHKAGELITAVTDATGASNRSVKRRIHEACLHGCVVKCGHGSYTLGSKKLEGGNL